MTLPARSELFSVLDSKRREPTFLPLSISRASWVHLWAWHVLSASVQNSQTAVWLWPYFMLHLPPTPVCGSRDIKTPEARVTQFFPPNHAELVAHYLKEGFGFPSDRNLLVLPCSSGDQLCVPGQGVRPVSFLAS